MEKQQRKPARNIDCTYDAEAAEKFDSTTTIDDSGIDMNKSILCGLRLNPFLTKYLPADAALQGKYDESGTWSQDRSDLRGKPTGGPIMRYFSTHWRGNNAILFYRFAYEG